jgi:Spy/CpxP family protein refolding chaperone
MGYNKLKVILIISLCLNVLFLSSYVGLFLTIRMFSTPSGRIHYITRQLKLTNAQQEVLAALSSTVQGFRKDLKQDHVEELNELCGELSKNDPDYGKIDQLMDKMLEVRVKFLGKTLEQIKPFMKVLTLEQRQIIVKKIEKLQPFVVPQ